MGQAITRNNQISLNSQLYNLKAPMQTQYVPRLANKINIGPDTFDAEKELSNWIISDQTGGILVDEMNETKHADRCWWTDCIINYDGHITLPRLATSISLPSTIAYASAALTNGDCEADGTGWSVAGVDATIARSATHKDGTYGYQLVSGASFNGQIYQSVTSSSYQSKTTYFWVWVRINSASSNNARAYIYDGKTTTYGTSHSVSSDVWELLTVSKSMAADATEWRVGVDGVTASTLYIDDASVPVTGTFCKMANFDSELWLAYSNILFKLASDRSALTFTGMTVTTITDVVPSLNSELYVFQGDTHNYYNITTADVFACSTTAATYSFQWDNKLVKATTAGVCTYSSDPNAVTPTWTAFGNITDIASQIERFDVGPDASANDIPYCATNSILKAYDSTNSKWVDTFIKLPNHPNGGKGFCYWRSAIFISYGLGVVEYDPIHGTRLETGLNRDGGLPVEYNGEIVKLYSDSNYEMFALVDSSQVTGTQKSGLYAYDGKGWFCWWASTSSDEAMYDVIISSASSANAVYWDCGNKIYYIDIPRGITSPKQLAGIQTYAASGVFLSPWFDAGSVAYDKLIKQITSFAKGITTTETAVIKYRLNKTYTDLATGWTTLDTLNTTGENNQKEMLIASGAGVEFGTIQIRLDLVRGSTTTLTPDITLAVGYQLITDGTWEWYPQIVIDEEYNTAKVKVTNIETLLTAGVLVPFIFRPEGTARYVRAYVLPGSWTETGEHYQGQYNLRLVEV